MIGRRVRGEEGGRVSQGERGRGEGELQNKRMMEEHERKDGRLLRTTTKMWSLIPQKELKIIVRC